MKRIIALASFVLLASTVSLAGTYELSGVSMRGGTFDPVNYHCSRVLQAIQILSTDEALISAKCNRGTLETKISLEEQNDKNTFQLKTVSFGQGELQANGANCLYVLRAISLLSSEEVGIISKCNLRGSLEVKAVILNH